MNLPLKSTPPLEMPQDVKFLDRLPLNRPISFLKTTTEGLHAFEVTHEASSQAVFASWTISPEDRMIAEAFHEVLKFSIDSAAAQLQGFFGLELLTLPWSDGMKNFHTANLSQILVNHARKLQPGERTLIQYGELWMLLQKRITEAWGKIEMKLRLECPARLDLLLRKNWREACENSGPGTTPVCVMVDIGGTPLFKFGDDLQTPKIRSWIAGLQKKSLPLPEFYFLRKDSLIRLRDQFGFA